jgi:hypothetical protein
MFHRRKNRIRDTAGNKCELVYNRIRDTVAPFLASVTIGLYGYEANNGMRGYVATGEMALEVSRRQLVSGSRRGQSSSVYASWSSEFILVSESVQCSAVATAGLKKLPVPVLRCSQ